MSAYAQGSSVSIVSSLGELDKLVSKYGATGFAYGRDDQAEATKVMFRIADRMVRFSIDKPDPKDFVRSPAGFNRRAPAEAQRFADAEERRRWRSLVLVTKALLVAVSDGIISLSDAFLAFTVLPSGQTAGGWLEPQLDTVYATATMPALLPGGQERAAIES